MATAVRKTPSTTQEVGGPMITATVRYKLPPHIELYEVFALTDNARGTVELFASPRPAVLTPED